MGRGFAGAIGVGWLCLVVAACGGSNHSNAPSGDQVKACLSGAGLTVEDLEDKEGIEAIGAQSPDGDVIVVIVMPEKFASEYDVAELINERIKRELRKLRRAGVWTSDSINGGATYIGTLGVKGVDGGVASASTEILARQCATKSAKT